MNSSNSGSFNLLAKDKNCIVLYKLKESSSYHVYIMFLLLQSAAAKLYIFKDKYSSSVQYNDSDVGLVINEAKFLLTIFLTCIEFCRRGWSQFVVTKDHTIPEPKENLFVAVNHGSYLWLNATISDIISHKSATTGDICSH